MGFRVLQIVIVGFWAVMTVLLVRSVVSEAARYREVPLVELASQVLAKRGHSSMLIFADGVEVGNANVSVLPRGKTGGDGSYSIRINGNLETAHLAKDGGLGKVTAAAQQMAIAIDATLNQTGEAERIVLTLEPKQSGMKITLGYEPRGKGVTYTISDGQRIVASNTGEGAPDLLEKSGGLFSSALTSSDLPFAGMPTEFGDLEGSSAGGAVSQLFVAKKGRAKVRGTDFAAYVLEIAHPLGGEPVRLIFSMAGELMIVENIPGHVILAEAFVKPPAPGEKAVLADR